ncbi:MAG: preprotein translocase subunit SecG [Andreesenia angusta]|nr:preprotein translocase subunit SecG [Andreesenia angusta]
MSTALMVIVVIASIILIVNVLMQEDKTGGLSGSIGGGATNDSAWSKSQGRSYEAISDKIVIISAIVIAVSIVISLAIK